jgi:hypothetical protein
MINVKNKAFRRQIPRRKFRTLSRGTGGLVKESGVNYVKVVPLKRIGFGKRNWKYALMLYFTFTILPIQVQ